jgi:hypothetical protein
VNKTRLARVVHHAVLNRVAGILQLVPTVFALIVVDAVGVCVVLQSAGRCDQADSIAVVITALAANQ